MQLQQDLITLEKQFWGGDADFYRRNLDEECLTAFADIAGVRGKEEIAGMVEKDRPRWRNLKIDQKGFIALDRDTAILTYEANADRANGEHYHALVSSGYVKRDGEWKLAFHQQTPLGQTPKKH